MLLVVDHPLAADRLTTLRDAGTDRATFRAAVRELAGMLVYEALRDAPTVAVPVSTPVATTTGARLASPPVLVPVLRAGLGMAEAAHGQVPGAVMGFVGMARDESSLEPTPYMESLPQSSPPRVRSRPPSRSRSPWCFLLSPSCFLLSPSWRS